MAGESIGYGTLVKIGDGADPEVFTTIPNVTDISGPESTVGEADVSSNSSPNASKEYLPTLKDSGPVTFNIWWVQGNAVHQGLQTDYEARTVRNFQMLFTDGTVVDFAAFINDLGHDTPMEGGISRSVSLRVTGGVTYTYP